MEPTPADLDIPPEQRARAALRALPANTHDATLSCPLCGTAVPARGLRAKPLRGVDQAWWQLVFTCPACGLLTAFDANRLSLEQIEMLRGSPWAAELRQFQQVARSEMPDYARQGTTQRLIGTFAVTFIAWLLLIGNFNPVEVAWGFLVSLVIARLTYRFAAIDLPGWMFSARRWAALGLLTVEFIRQLVVQNVTLSIRVLRPDLPIRPGIVAIPTDLRGDVELALLGSLVTLTPDTVTMDIDQQKGIIYVHWIDVRSTEPSKAQQMISASLERKIADWLD